jgi:Zn-finger nucleic acid-binding protein
VNELEGATIDRCPAHGVWFDPQELETVLQRAGTEPTGVVAWLRRLFA